MSRAPVITQVGMASITYKGREYVLDPSLSNMAKIQDHAQLVHSLVGSGVHPETRLAAAVEVLQACCSSQDDADEIHWMCYGAEVSKPRVRNGSVVGWVRRKQDPVVSPIHAICIAAQLVRHGIFANYEHEHDEEDSEPDVFRPEKMAAIAQAHLGLSRDDAWSLSMSSLVNALQEKFPPPPEVQARKRLRDRYDELIKIREAHAARKKARRNK